MYAQQDTIYSSIMLIPFNPKMYISDVDRALTTKSELSPEEIREKFRLGLDVNLHAQIFTKYNSKPLLKDTSATAFKDLVRIYHSLNYEYAIPERTLLEVEEENKKFKNKIKGFFKKEKEEETIEHGLFHDETSKEVRRYDEDKYLKASVTDINLLPYLHQTYQTELFLFVNQFEITTDFESCIDLQNGIYERVMKVHFNVYDKNNNMLQGDYSEVRFPSTQNDIIFITREHLPKISQHLSTLIPYYK